MGNISETIEFNKSQNEKPRVHCAKCTAETRHVVLQSVDESGSEHMVPDDEFNTIDWTNTFQIIQCQGCETISFRHVHWFSEAQDFNSDGKSERLYPHAGKKALQSKDFLNVPSALRRIYREIIDCFNYECLTMCAGGLRAIVEGMCLENGVNNGSVEKKDKNGNVSIKRVSTLDGKIAGLHEKGILTKDQADVLHELRFLGNDALHQLLQPSPCELALAIEIIEHTLTTLYEIPDKVNALRKSKTHRRKK